MLIVLIHRHDSNAAYFIMLDYDAKDIVVE